MEENKKREAEEYREVENSQDDSRNNLEEDNTQLQNEIENEQIDVEDLMKQLEGYKEEREEYYNRYLRVMADLENYKKRMTKERESLYQNATCEVLTQLLGVLDNMERASQSLNTNDDCNDNGSIEEGITMVTRQLKDVLTKFGVEEISAEDEKFDPNYHYAVMQAESPDKEEGVIIEVLQKGYKTNSRLLRPSMVKVAK